MALATERRDAAPEATGFAYALRPLRKLACMTLDFETDYGARLGGAFNILHETEQLAELRALFRSLEVPVSAFIRTDVLDDFPESLELVRSLACDWHCHSHTHSTAGFEGHFEIRRTQQAFTTAFGTRALGYRAPLGMLHDGDLALLKAHGFKFSSSIFPTRFPGRYDNRSLPTSPFVYENGVVELPFAVVPRLRTVVSLSFLKLLGLALNRALIAAFGLPEIVVFDSHLHDFIYCERSYRELPARLRVAWGVNRRAGMRYYADFVRLLRGKGYEFLTMTRLYEHVRSLPRC